MAQLGAMLFDAYGTLFDLNSAVKPHVERLGDPALKPMAKTLGEYSERLLALWRQKQLEYTWTATLRNAYRGFDAITRDALAFALARKVRPLYCTHVIFAAGFRGCKKVSDVTITAVIAPNWLTAISRENTQFPPHSMRFPPKSRGKLESLLGK